MMPLYTAYVDRWDGSYRAKCLDFPRAEGYGDSPEDARHDLMCMINSYYRHKLATK